MIENQCESNCECVETQSSSGNNNSANECCQMTNKTSNSSCCSDDPIAAAKSLLERSFFTALTEVHVEKLKKQIETEWGSTIDKAVDLTIKTVAKQWQASLSKSAVNKEFYSELEKIFKTTKE
ncbi:MAG: hypothetical protein QOK72_03830 [Nitrososphaeraceae archaeon]|jgi:hypothetical protein|nr:hypothetical protein [Nitrososphaeraceae archaeon]HJY14520.1 hypothetical protein [Nitrososphaeraceae archaeon]